MTSESLNLFLCTLHAVTQMEIYLFTCFLGYMYVCVCVMEEDLLMLLGGRNRVRLSLIQSLFFRNLGMFYQPEV